MSYYGTNRYICSVLEEMRDKLKILDEHNLIAYKSIALMNIEEIQSLANIMEAGLGDKKDLMKLKQERSKLKKQVEKLKRTKAALSDEEEEPKKSRVQRLIEGID